MLFLLSSIISHSLLALLLLVNALIAALRIGAIHDMAE